MQGQVVGMLLSPHAHLGTPLLGHPTTLAHGLEVSGLWLYSKLFCFFGVVKSQLIAQVPKETVPDCCLPTYSGGSAKYFVKSVYTFYGLACILGLINPNNQVSQRDRVFIKGRTSSRGQIVIVCAASGGTLAPQPAAHHRGRARDPSDYSQSFPPFLVIFCLFGDRTSLFFGSNFDVNLTFLSDFKSDVQDVRFRENGRKYGLLRTTIRGTLVRPMSRAAATGLKPRRLPRSQSSDCLLNFFLSSLLAWWKVNLITSLSGWWIPKQSRRTQKNVPDRCLPMNNF